MKKKRILSAGDFPNSKGGIYNPSVINFNNELICITRVESKPEHKRKDWLDTTAEAYLTYLDSDLNTLHSTPLTLIGFETIEAFRIEDFRLFEFCGVIHVAHPLVTKEGVRQALSKIVDNTLVLVHTFDSPFDRQVEKNWGFFVDKEELFVLYSIDPWVIYRVRSDYSLELVVRDNYNGKWEVNKEDSMLSLSTLPILYNGQSYLTITHSRVSGKYIQGAILFDRDSFLPVYGTSQAFLRGGKEKGIRPNVLYVSGIHLTEKEIHLFYGEGDTHSSVYTIGKLEFNKIIYKNKIIYDNKTY